jgi:hypothetical protein
LPIRYQCAISANQTWPPQIREIYEWRRTLPIITERKNIWFMNEKWCVLVGRDSVLCICSKKVVIFAYIIVDMDQLSTGWTFRFCHVSSVCYGGSITNVKFVEKRFIGLPFFITFNNVYWITLSFETIQISFESIFLEVISD